MQTATQKLHWSCYPSHQEPLTRKWRLGKGLILVAERSDKQISASAKWLIWADKISHMKDSKPNSRTDVTEVLF